MSCHDIGRGMASVVDAIMEEYWNNNIELASARRLIRACVKGVSWCDGNEYEALQTIMESTCGCCLNKMSSKEGFLYSITDLDGYDFEKMEDLANYNVCEDCLKKLIEKNGNEISLKIAKDKCEQITPTYYFKLRDLLDIKFGQRNYEQVCKEYGYE